MTTKGGTMGNVLSEYEELLDAVGDPIPAALLVLAAAIDRHARATRAIAGGGEELGGLEGLAVAIAGRGLHTPLSDAVNGLAAAVAGDS
jgi:hypothetical protein